MQVDHGDIVRILHAQQPPDHTVDGALAFTVRVIRALPAVERAGLLLKDGGENVAIFGARMVSAGRVCYPDGQLYKVLSDIPTTEAPIWNDDGLVDAASYFPLPDIVPAPGDAPPPVPIPPGDEDWPTQFVNALDRIADGIDGLIAGVNGLSHRLDSLDVNGVKLRLR